MNRLYYVHANNYRAQLTARFLVTVEAKGSAVAEVEHVWELCKAQLDEGHGYWTPKYVEFICETAASLMREL